MSQFIRIQILIFVALLLPYQYSAAQSTCYGTTSAGRLSAGEQLPLSGKNFVSYSQTAHLLGRTYVHSEVKKIILNTYATLANTYPNNIFKYAETGFKEGGGFKPHKTHQNGLSVDFMTPVINNKGRSAHLPTHALNKFGYDIEFDEQGNYGVYAIDYTAMAAHIVSLHKEAKRLGYDLWRVIFDPQLQPALFKTKYGAYLKKHIQFSKKRSWVRHDEHYHVDFSIPCQK